MPDKVILPIRPENNEWYSLIELHINDRYIVIYIEL